MLRLALSFLITLGVAAVARASYDWDPDWYETGTVGDGWGDAATTVGDVNGDGYSDILIGSPQYGGSPYWSKGKIELYYGSPTGPGSVPDWSYTLNIAFQQMGKAIAPAGDMNGDGFADFVVGAPTYSNGESEEGRLYFFLGSATGPVSWAQAEINEEGAWLGHAVAFAGDVNGDGYDDVIAGAPYWGGYGSPFYIPVQGRAYIYYGGPSGPDGTYDWSRSGGDENAEFGWDVAGLGDVNGDGYADVMVGKPGYDPGLIGTDFGAIYAYYGSASGPSTTSDWSQVGAHVGDEFGRELAFAGDFNGDGFADALIGVPHYNGGVGAFYVASGAPSGLGTAGLWSTGSSGWGGTISTIGDFNGDGRTDLIVGGGTDDDAYVYFGNLLDGLEQRIVGSGQFATTVASAGDVNGDGLGDFLVTDPLDQNGAGSVRIYFGGQEINYSVPLFAARSAVDGSQEEAGRALADAGDVNGDGVGDLLVGAPGASGVGEIHLFYGSHILNLSNTPDWTASGDGPGGRFGAAVSSAGDVNGDGYADLVATDPDLQQVKVFHGSASGPSATADWVYTYPEAGEEFGAAVTGGGDLNGDGYADIAVGIPGYGVDYGRVRIFYGSPAGITDFNTVDLNPASYNDRYGTSVAIFGDGNGDGYDDIVVGAPGNFGKVFFHYGAASGFQGFYTTLAGSSSGSQMGAAVAAAGDVNGDGYADAIVGEPYADIDAIDDGQAHIFLGSTPTMSGLITFGSNGPFDNEHFGQSVCGLGAYTGADRSMVAASLWDGSGQLTVVRVYQLSDLTGLMVAQSSFEISHPEGMPIAGVGDLDADGSPEIGFGEYTNSGNDGDVYLYGPIPARYLLPPSARPAISTTAGNPIALRGLMHHTDDLRLSLTAWLPVGRTHLNMEWNCGVERQAYADAGIGTWTPSATHIGGTPLSVDPGVPLTPGVRYRWRTRVLSTNPYVPHGPWLTMQPNCDTLYGLRVVDTVTAADEPALRRSTSLDAAAPNPFNPSTQIEFRLGERGPVNLSIYNVAGRLVRKLQQGDLEAGVHRVAWTGVDDTGARVASGVYVAVLRAGEGTSSLKLSLVK